MSLQTKMLISFLPVVLVGSLLTIVSLYGTPHVHQEDFLVERYSGFRTTLRESQIAHLSFLRIIENGFWTNAGKIAIGTDGTKCAFGRWYYGENSGLKATEKLDYELAEKLTAIGQLHLDIHELGRQLSEHWDNGEKETAKVLYSEEICTKAESLLDTLDDLSTRSEELANFHADQSNKYQRQQMYALVLIFGIGMAVALPFAYFTARSIVKAVRQGVWFAEEIGKGHVTARLHLSRKDEIGVLMESLDRAAANMEAQANVAMLIAEGDLLHEVQLASDDDIFGKAFQKMIASLRDSMMKLSTISEKVSDSASTMSSASDGISKSTQEDSGKIAEIVSDLAKINAQTKGNATNAADADHVAASMKTAAAEGRTKMERMTESMDNITAGSNEIRKIIRVIDDIAFQTNLLALNAAVEAARAGTHGKGFAVVAEEVRNLAARSAKAAKETADLIAQSIQQVEVGSQVAQETSESLNLIAEQADHVSAIISHINTGSTEQADGLHRINDEVEQFSRGTTERMAHSEETASMAHDLSGMAETLHQIVAQFKV